MALDEQLRQLASEVPAPPPGDATKAFLRGVRRRHAQRALGIAAGIVVVAVIAVGLGSLREPASRLPEVADQPEQPEIADQPEQPEVADQPEPSEADRAHPDGWVLLRAGELKMAVPPDWQIHTVEPAPDPTAQAGPCVYDLYGGIENLADELTEPLATVYPMESTGQCRLVGIPEHPPAQPSILLYASAPFPDGGSRPRGAVDQRIGTVDMWRLEGEPDERIVELRQRDGQGGLLVSHIDDPIVQQVLETLRATDPIND